MNFCTLSLHGNHVQGSTYQLSSFLHAQNAEVTIAGTGSAHFLNFLHVKAPDLVRNQNGQIIMGEQNPQTPLADTGVAVDIIQPFLNDAEQCYLYVLFQGTLLAIDLKICLKYLAFLQLADQLPKGRHQTRMI